LSERLALLEKTMLVVKEDTLKITLERIGSKLTDLRKQKGYTSHEDFAYDFDIPRVQYWRIEKGKTNVTVKSLCRILTIHKITLEEFFCMVYKEPGI
jgi:transcriptional regulator with XRE-family HTH domain